MADIADRSPRPSPGEPEHPGDFEGWFRYVLQRGTTRNGVFGAKMMWNYFDDFRARVARAAGPRATSRFNEALDVVFPNLRIIFVRRRDKVAQAVSLWKAIQTQQWRTTRVTRPTKQSQQPRPSTTSAPSSTCSTSSTAGTPMGGLVPRHRP